MAESQAAFPMHFFVVVVACALVALVPPARAATSAADSGGRVAENHAVPRDNGRKVFALTPHRLEKCDFFLVTEAAVGRADIRTQDAIDPYAFTNSFGVMRNIGPRSSIGAALELHLAMGTVTASPALRFRRWFGSDQSAELSLCYVTNSGRGLTGPLLSARYSPASPVFVQAGVCGLRTDSWSYDPGLLVGHYDRRVRHRVVGSVGLAGGAGAVVWAAELVVVGGLLVALSGLSD